MNEDERMAEETKYHHVMKYLDECLRLNNANSKVAFVSLISLAIMLAKTFEMKKENFDLINNDLWESTVKNENQE